MKYSKIIIVILVTVILGVAAFYSVINKGSVPRAILETQTAQVENVTIKVTPEDISRTSGEWKFEIVLDTHSGSLNQDFQSTAVLLDDKGNEYKPIGWDGSPKGGHHREGILKFKPIGSTGTIELRIDNIVGEKDQSFKWTLNQ